MAENNIKVERARFGYSQTELAEMIGVSLQSIRNWEKDIGQCSGSNLLALCNVFGVSLDYLVGLTDRRERNIETRNV